MISSDTSETEGGASGGAGVSITGTTGGWDTGIAAGVLDFRKVKGLGKSNGSVKRVLGFAPDTFHSSTMGVPAVTSGATATVGASGAKLAELLAKSGGKTVALPCPERTAGVDG